MDWNGGMENRMDYGISSTAEDTTSHCVPASFVPSTLSDSAPLLQLRLLATNRMCPLNTCDL